MPDMQVIAVQAWNHHAPGTEMVRVLPGDLMTVPDSIGRYMIKEKWAKGA